MEPFYDDVFNSLFILNISPLNEASTAAITAPSTKGALAIQF